MEIVVYSKDHCPYCDQAKALLKSKGIQFEERKIGDGYTKEELLEAVPNYIPGKEDFIRLKTAKGSWEITPLKDNKTQIKYQVMADPEGSLPPMIINMFIVDGPYTTLQNLKERIGE